MNITRLSQNDSNDFIIEGNHAKISQVKVAEITKVNKSTVSRWVAQTTKLQYSNPELEYLSGVVLKDFVTYLALDAKRISTEVRNHNIKLLSDASDVGFQILIDKMAGIDFSQPNQESGLSLKEVEFGLNMVLGMAKFASDEEKTQMMINCLTEYNPSYGKILKPIQIQARIATANDRIPLTPTELGKKIGVSGQEINKRLLANGFQILNPDHEKSKRNPRCLLTDKGQEFGKYLTSAGKSGDNSLYQQLLWFESVLAEI